MTSYTRNSTLKNIVRTQVYEFLLEHYPQRVYDFLLFIEKWQPDDTPDSSDENQPIPRLCQQLFHRISSENQAITASIQWLNAVWQQSSTSKTETALEINELAAPKIQPASTAFQPTGFPAQINCSEIVGNAPSWQKLIGQAIAVAQSEFPVLIIGETGVGKELIAQCIHNNSRRRSKDCVFVNCGGVPDSLTAAEFHGYASGAFTGASRNGRKGWFEQANGGTLVLDEISELPLASQPILLRALQSGEAQKIGGNTVNVDFRLVAISNKQLETEVNSGKFRRDLFYRLAVIPLYVPPLRERKTDIKKLALHFLNIFKNDNPQLSNKFFSPESFQALKEYAWYGNVRELQNVVARALVLCPGNIILPEHLVFNHEVNLQIDSSDDTANGRTNATYVEKIGRIPADQVTAFLDSRKSGFSTGDYAHHFSMSEATARRHLHLLEEDGVVSCRGRGRGTKYHIATA